MIAFWMDDYCPPCQMKILVEFSKNLHDFNADFCRRFCLKITMKFYTCGCLFDYYNYLMHCWGGVFVKADKYQKDNVGKTFTFPIKIFFLYKAVIRAFFLYSKYNLEHVNDRLKRISLFYLSYLTISRFYGHANTCFEMLQIYLRATECDPNKAMTVCCGF